jgi:hypothetical protein
VLGTWHLTMRVHKKTLPYRQGLFMRAMHQTTKSRTTKNRRFGI